MYYRLSYSYNDITDEIGISTSRDLAEIEAWNLLDTHNQIGSVVIERRPSEYYGEYEHILTISQGLDSDIRHNDNNILSDPVPSSVHGRRIPKELCIFKKIRLEGEPRELRRLMWICECKSLAMNDSYTRKVLTDLQKRQIETIEKSGMSPADIEKFAEFYEFAYALSMD